MKTHAVEFCKSSAPIKGRSGSGNKRALLALLCAIAGFSALANASAASVVDNGDFEAGSGTTATDWNFVADNPPVRSETVFHGGSHSVRTYAQTDPLGAGHSSEANQVTVFNTVAPLAVVPGESYTLSLWLQDIPTSEFPEGYTTVGVVSSVVLIWTDATAQLIGGNVLSQGPFFPGGQATWTHFEATGLVAPEGAAGALIQLISSTGANDSTAGGMYFDDITLSSGGGGGGGSTNRATATIAAGTQVSWNASSGNEYQPQKSPDNSAWTSLAGPFSGNAVTSVFETAQSPFYRVLEVVPGGGGGSGGVVNGGFETAGASPTNAANWTVNQAVGSPQLWYGRTNDSPHSGTYAFEIHLAANFGQGPVVSLQQAGVPVTGGTTYPFTFWAKMVAGSAGAVTQWRIVWNVGGETGFKNYTPGNNTYAFISNSVAVPAGATTATISFYTPGAADTNQTATLLLDDVALGSSGGGSSGSTNTIPAVVRPGVQISWASDNGVGYAVESTPELSESPTWSPFTTTTGNGGIKSVTDSLTNPQRFYQVLIQP